MNAFWDCRQLKSVVLEDGVTTIEFQAFMHCTALASVSIPDSVTEIGINAFYNTALTAVSIPAAASLGYALRLQQPIPIRLRRHPTCVKCVAACMAEHHPFFI